MRKDIKFRGKRTDNGEWVYGDLIRRKDSFGDIVIIGSYKPDYFYDEHQVDPSTVGQFAGLKDRNGKEIYEGDVVFVDCSSVAGSFEDGTYKVEYLVPDCMFALIQMDNKNGITFNECYLYEVIGNIHENPELL